MLLFAFMPPIFYFLLLLLLFRFLFSVVVLASPSIYIHVEDKYIGDLIKLQIFSVAFKLNKLSDYDNGMEILFFMI